jgi:hypothetical protein
MERRTFIKNACAVAGMGLLLQACNAHKYITDFSVSTDKIIIKKTAFTIVKKGATVQQKFILLKPEQFQFPIVVYKGCELTPYETTLVCPCHGAEFNRKGEVTQGPADTNLKFFTTTQDDEHLYIQF